MLASGRYTVLIEIMTKHCSGQFFKHPVYYISWVKRRHTCPYLRFARYWPIFNIFSLAHSAVTLLHKGSIATRLRCNGIFNDKFIANLLMNLPVKVWRNFFFKLVNAKICIYKKCLLFGSQCRPIRRRERLESVSGRLETKLGECTLSDLPARHRPEAVRRIINMASVTCESVQWWSTV